MVDEEEYDTSKKQDPRIPKVSDPHGSYAFDPHARRFYLTMRGGNHAGGSARIGGGFILLRMLSVVQLNLTVTVDVEEFDGPALVQNVAALLQIDLSRIKIVKVQTRAEVAAAGGGRRLSNNHEVIIHIVEPNPAPVPGEAFADAMPPESTDNTGTPAPTTESDQADNVAAYSFSQAGLADLHRIAEQLQALSDAGTLEITLSTDGMTVVLNSIVVSDPEEPMAPNETDVDGETARTTIVVQVSSDDDKVWSIILGTIVGILVGGIASTIGMLMIHTACCKKPSQTLISPGVASE